MSTGKIATAPGKLALSRCRYATRPAGREPWMAFSVPTTGANDHQVVTYICDTMRKWCGCQ